MKSFVGFPCRRSCLNVGTVRVTVTVAVTVTVTVMVTVTVTGHVLAILPATDQTKIR